MKEENARDAKRKEQQEMCAVIDQSIEGGGALTPEYQYEVFKTEQSYSKIVENYTRYTKAVVWMNFCFKIIYFLGSCAVLYVITRALLEVVYFTINGLKPESVADAIVLFITKNSSKTEMLLTALSAFITAVIVIPVTITKYLFNQKEVEQFTALLQSVQHHSERMLLSDKENEHPNSQAMLKKTQEEDTQREVV